MNKTLVRSFAVIVLALFGLAAYGCHEENQDEQNRRIENQQWAQFSAQHHCKIVRDEKWSEASIIWQCDGGFQVRRWAGQ